MDITLFLASLWGPVMFLIGLGIFVSRSYYVKIYRDLDKDALAVLAFGTVMATVGLAQIAVHNVYETLPEIIISLLGWGTLLKGAVFIVVPNLADKSADYAAKAKLLAPSAVLLLVLGGYLTWISYFA